MLYEEYAVVLESMARYVLASLFPLDVLVLELGRLTVDFFCLIDDRKRTRSTDWPLLVAQSLSNGSSSATRPSKSA